VYHARVRICARDTARASPATQGRSQKSGVRSQKSE